MVYKNCIFFIVQIYKTKNNSKVGNLIFVINKTLSEYKQKLKMASIVVFMVTIKI